MINTYKGKKIWISGVTGFKGSWLAKWLLKLGATIQGFALTPNTLPNHFELLNLEKDIQFIDGDVRNYDSVRQCIQDFKPDMIFHLAAQPIVRQSYSNPHYTFDTNIMGTINILEVCKKIKEIQTIIIITSDKVYENIGESTQFKEHDKLGGYDPYSASKACAEIIVSSYRDSFFNNTGTLLSSVRAGNVIGGGDWSDDRIIPDIIRSITNKEKLEIRNPYAIRPWQHVLDCLYGYLLLNKMMLNGKEFYASAWNFGPSEESEITVENVIKQVDTMWPVEYFVKKSDIIETPVLKLNSEKAKTFLGWNPLFDIKKTINLTIDWYKSYYEHNIILTEDQIDYYMENCIL